MKPLQILSSLAKTYPQAPCLDLSGAALLLDESTKSASRELALSLPFSPMLCGYSVPSLATILPQPRVYKRLKLGELVEFAAVVEVEILNGVLTARAYVRLEKQSGIGSIDPPFTFDARGLAPSLEISNQGNFRALVGDFFRPIFMALAVLASGRAMLEKRYLALSKNQAVRKQTPVPRGDYLTIQAAI